MTEKVKNRLILLISTVVVVMCIVLVLSFALRPTETDEAYAQIETFHSLPKETVEVIVYGSSHAFQGVNTMELYERYGIGAYNYSWNWQKINTTKAFIKDSFIDQSPRVILIETYLVNELLSDIELNPEYYYCRYLHLNEAKKELMMKCLGENPSLDRIASYILPFYMFHSDWKSLTFERFKPLSIGSKFRKSMGFSESNEITVTTIPDYRTFNQLQIDSDALMELEDILKVCKEKGAEVIFFTCPLQKEYCYSNALKKFCGEHDCTYLDLYEKYDETGIDALTDFADPGHLNTSGATKVADFIGDYLIKNYELTNMKLISNNIWEQALKID